VSKKCIGIGTTRERNRVARWFVFKSKIPMWVNLGCPYIGKCLYTYLMAIWNI
jgi:hypothetical protein